MLAKIRPRHWLLPLLIVFLTGCSNSAPVNKVARYNLHLVTRSQINDGAPLKVRVMLLTSDAEFMSADFYSLQNHPSSVLGKTLLNNQQFFLMPGKQDKALNAKSMPDARYIAVMAEYQTLNNKVWRLALPFPDPEKSKESFWKFWKSDDGELNATIVVGNNGLQIVGDTNE